MCALCEYMVVRLRACMCMHMCDTNVCVCVLVWNTRRNTQRDTQITRMHAFNHTITRQTMHTKGRSLLQVPPVYACSIVCVPVICRCVYVCTCCVYACLCPSPNDDVRVVQCVSFSCVRKHTKRTPQCVFVLRAVCLSAVPRTLADGACICPPYHWCD